jgi:hypothetical protein
MKKRVRIYKAQEGGMPNVDTMGYPGAGSQQMQEIDDNQLASAVLTDIGNSEPRERIIIKLVNTYGKDPMEAQQFVDQIYQYVEQQKQSEIDDAEEEDDDSEAVTAGTDTIEEAEVEQVRQTPTGTEMSNEIIDEWNDSSDDDSQVAADIIMRYGGYPRAQEGMEVPIQMPDVSAYLPESMGDYLGGATNPYADLAWSAPSATEEDETVFSDYAEPQLPEEYRMGGMPSKRSYVNSVLKLVKKQMGGDSAAPASAKFDDDNADPTGANVRKKSLDKFIGSVKNQSAMAFAKKQAEQNYDQMMQMQQAPAPQFPIAQQGGEQDIYAGQDFENPMHHLALFSQATGDVFQDEQNQITQAQFGGLFGGRRNRLNAYTGGYNMPRGFQGMPPITKMDVRRSGWFGKPKEYSIEFGQGSPMPGMGMPGQGVGFYGYGARTIKYPATRIKVESEAASVNNKAKEEIAATTPDSKATTDAAKTDVTTTVSTTTQGTVASSTVPGNTQPTQTVTTEGKTETTPVNPTVVKPTVTETEVETEIKPGGAVKTPETGIELTYTKDRKGAAFYQKDGKYYVIPDENNYDVSYEVTDPKRIENIKKFKGDQTLNYQYIPGKDFNYKRNKYGEWEFQSADAPRTKAGYVDDNADNWNLVTNPETLKILANDPRSGKGSKSQSLLTLESKPGYYYRQRNDGSYEKFEGDPKKHYSGKKATAVITDEKTIDYLNNEIMSAPDINPSAKAPKPDTRQEKNWTTEDGGKATSYQGTYTTTLGQVVPARYQIVKDKNGKIIPKKSFAAVTQSQDYGGVIYVPWEDLPQGQKKNGGAIHQMGGSINNPIANQYGDLQKFIGGGNEDFTQGDLDDVYSKDTANGDFPMAQYGYAVQNLFPANVMPTQYAKMKGVPYDPRTGKPVANYMPGVGTGIKKIDVTKSSWLTGRPKKYTVTYGTQEMDPRKQNLITLPGSGTETVESQVRAPQRQRTDVSDLRMRAAMAVRKGERQAYRNDKRLARHPEYWNTPTMENIGYPGADPIGTTPGFDAQKAMDYMRQSLTVPNLPETAPQGTPFSADMLYNMSGPRADVEMQYGGDLQRFIAKAQDGFQSPVVYTNNPAMHGMSQVDMISLNPGIQGSGTGSLDMGFMNKNIPTRDTSNDPKEQTIDPTQIGSHQAENVYAGPGEDVAVDYKVKNSVDPEAYVNVANARQEAKMSDNLTADNLYASDPSKDRGDYESNSGLYRPDEMGQKWNSRSKQYGGNIYQDGGMVEGDEVFMTDEEIQEFLANGGDLEFI